MTCYSSVFNIMVIIYKMYFKTQYQDFLSNSLHISVSSCIPPLSTSPLLLRFLLSVRVVPSWSSSTSPGVIRSLRMASKPWCGLAQDSKAFF